MFASHRLHLMGTVIDLTIDSDKPSEHIKHLVAKLHLYTNRFSANDSQSELMAINHKAGLSPIYCHPQLVELIAIGKQHSLAYPSQLNIAIGPLVQLWRIGFKEAQKPRPDEIKTQLLLTNPRDIQLDSQNKSVFLKHTGMKLDLGALAKGYIADQLVCYLKSKGVRSAMLNLGGNILTYGAPAQAQESHWSIGIQQPMQKRGLCLGYLHIKNRSVVTSGIYERYLKIGPKTYHHILDRHTGYPIKTSIVSLTIISKTSLDGEIWTSRLFGYELEVILSTVESLEGIEAIIITQERAIYITTGLSEHFSALPFSGYQLIINPFKHKMQ
ncbi:FAD:protein FMN transferase [Streptococcus sp. zg-JUN1979]|uniref:FAD:protein FMN transferase n=1 Tax=Streptococcus sp. zg-JUN1979 TaxID=3391450 RepID=UPI0039A71E1E